jgi:hypothetical protein
MKGKYQSKDSITHREEEEILAVHVRDGKMKPEEEDFLYIGVDVVVVVVVMMMTTTT